MTAIRTLLIAPAIALIWCVLADQASAATLEVGTCPVSQEDGPVFAHFATIQAAVNAASAGGTVLVCPGSYPEQVEISKPLNLKGVRSGNMAAAVVIPPPTGTLVPPSGITASAPQVFVHDTSGPVTVSNLTVDATDVASCTSQIFVIGVYFLNAPGKIEDVVTRNQSVSVDGTSCFAGIGIRATADVAPTEITIEDNNVSGYDFGGIFASLQMANVIVRHNSLVGMPGAAGIIQFFDVTGTVSENSVADNSLGGIGVAVVGVHNAVISHNNLAHNSYGVAFYTFQGDPNSDNGTVIGNDVFGSDVDGIAICGDNNVVRDNTIAASTESAVNLITGPNFGAQCTANNNTVINNTINGACAGNLIDPNTSGNTAPENTIFNATNVQITGISCPMMASASMAVAAQSIHRPKPVVMRPGN